VTWDELRRAACREHPTEWWDTAASRAQQHHALAICHTCPVLDSCRTDALAARTSGVIQGGIRFHPRPDQAARQRRELTAAQTAA
jgi:hypothetical protein